MPESVPGKLVEDVVPYLRWIAMAGLGIEIARMQMRSDREFRKLREAMEFSRNYFLVHEETYDGRYDLILHEEYK